MGRTGRWKKSSASIPHVQDEEVPRLLRERTGKHYCIRCLKETPAEEWFDNDHTCDDCAEKFERELTPRNE
jgi:hypothetical protein